MLKTFFIALFALFSTLNASTLRVATYNVWNPLFEQKYSGKESWNQRLPFIINNILASKSDLICLEEVGKQNYLDLIQNRAISDQYLSFYISHASTKLAQKEGRDGLAFFYKPERVMVIKLVPSPDGSRPTHRRDFYVDLKLKDEHPILFRVASTHLDSGKDLSIGNEQLIALVNDTFNDSLEVDFVILCGDFNEGEDEESRPRSTIMTNAGFITDGSTASTRPEALDVRHKGHVDWIYFKKLSAIDFELKPVNPIGDEKGSDHKLTITDILFN